MIIGPQREVRKTKFVSDIMRAREDGLSDIKSVIEEMRGKKWAIPLNADVLACVLENVEKLLQKVVEMLKAPLSYSRKAG